MKTITDDDLQQLVAELASELQAKSLSIATAESCTGGWLAKCCTDLPGSSNWFDRGFIPYSNQAKKDCLSVTTKTLNHFGAVSEQTALEMAKGALKHSRANLSVAITGIAGPDGGTLSKPVGTVWFAWATSPQHAEAALHTFSGDREMIRKQAVVTAINGIIKNARDSSLTMG